MSSISVLVCWPLKPADCHVLSKMSNGLDVAVDHHIRGFPLTAISIFAPFTGLILSVVLLTFFLIRFYVLELFLLQKLHGKRYTNLDEINRRGFVNNHIAGATKILILVVGAYPFFNVAFGKAGFHTPFAAGSRVTMGDILIICAQILIGMFIFGLIYRTKISPVSVVHHMGSILVGQAAITISIRLDKDASVEFVLCTVWGTHSFSCASYHDTDMPKLFSLGAFDIISEFLPHLAIMLYRVFPENHSFLSRLFQIAFVSTLFGTISETVVVMYLFGQLWDRWTSPFKIVTPVLHVAFSAAQLHGSHIFYKMWRKQERILRDSREIKLGSGGESERALGWVGEGSAR